jgi:MFS family permease
MPPVDAPDPYRISSTSPRFLSYLAASALGAMNDNAFKLGVLVLAMSTVEDESTRLAYSSVITIVFALPWLIFSPLAGYFADRYSKKGVLFATKAPEVVFMAVSIVGFALENVPMLMLVFFLMSAQAAFYSTPKYGLLPEVFDADQIAKANGVLGIVSSVAVLVGTAFGTWIGAHRDTLGNIGWIYLGIALLGTALAAWAPHTPPGFPGAPFRWDPVRQTVTDYRAVRGVPALRPTIIGLMLFTFLSSLLLTVVPVYCIDVLGIDAGGSALVITALVLGVATGSGIAGFIARGRVELGLVPLGVWLTAIFALDVAFLPPQPAGSQSTVPVRVFVDFVLIGMGGGLFTIPLTAHLQQQSPEDQKGQIIAYSNVAANVMICAAALLPLGAGALIEMLGVQRGAVRLQMMLLAAIALGGAVYFTFFLAEYRARFRTYLRV